MPIYEYECEHCSSRFDVRRSFGDSAEVSCPMCRGEARRLFSPVPIVFKGSGFYATDSRDGYRGDTDSGDATEVGGSA